MHTTHAMVDTAEHRDITSYITPGIKLSYSFFFFFFFFYKHAYQQPKLHNNGV